MKRPVIASLVGGVVVASLASLTALRLQYMKETKEELSTLPYGPENPLTWKNFFKNYDGRS